MPDIYLIQPPIRDFYLTRKRTLPYGLASIAAALRQWGFSVEIFDGLATAKSRILPWPAEMSYLTPHYGRMDNSPFGLFHHFRHFGYSVEHIARQAKASGAFLVGISSLFTAYADTALEVAAAVKRCCPRALIVIGGHHPTAAPGAVMAHPAVDFAVRGDGELALPPLAAAIRSGGSLDNIPGLVRRRSAGGLSVAPPARAEDLNRLPAPAIDLIQWKYYRRAGGASYTLAATRGCPMRCTYCAVNSATFHGFRQRSVDSVMAEIEAACQYRPMGFIDFEDEHLGARKSWMVALMQRMARRFGAAGPELRAMNGLYAPVLDDDVMRAMRQAGFKTLNLALITTAKAQLQRFGRPDITDAVDRVLSRAGALSLNSVAYLIVAGPDQVPEQSVDDLLFLASRRVLAGVSVFYPAPGSVDYRWCRDKGLLPPHQGLLRATALPLAHLTRRTQAVTLLRLGRILNFMKHLYDSGASLPLPARVPSRLDTHADRGTIGRQLLAGFLKDGSVYGMAPDGLTYRHRIDGRLTLRFLKGLERLSLNGAVG